MAWMVTFDRFAACHARISRTSATIDAAPAMMMIAVATTGGFARVNAHRSVARNQTTTAAARATNNTEETAYKRLARSAGVPPAVGAASRPPTAPVTEQ